MKKQEVLEIIKEHKRELTEIYGVKSLALFRSVARDEALQDRLEELFGRKVDLGTPDSLKPRLRSSVMSELVYVP
jgi:uncharacterized protein